MDIDFSKQLIKGKIVETIFEEMFRAQKEFTIIPLGYEHTTPILAQYQHYLEVKQVLENIRNSPDFALISEDKKRVFLVEVKYRNEPRNDEILQIANETIEKWNPCFIFLASQTDFYFSPCRRIIARNGEMELLRESWIRKDIQDEFKKLLVSFIR